MPNEAVLAQNEVADLVQPIATGGTAQAATGALE